MYFGLDFLCSLPLEDQIHRIFWCTNNTHNIFDDFSSNLLTNEAFLSRFCSWGIFIASLSTNYDWKYEKYSTRFLKNHKICKSLPWIFFSFIVHVHHIWLFPTIRHLQVTQGCILLKRIAWTCIKNLFKIICVSF